MRISQQQSQGIADAMFAEKLDGAMRRSVPAYAELSQEGRASFIADCRRDAAVLGLRTEQGIASYALAMWFLEPGFETRSRHLMALLASGFPEVRKVHAMNEWVHVLLGDPGNLAAADEALKQGFYSTKAWGGPVQGQGGR